MAAKKTTVPMTQEQQQLAVKWLRLAYQTAGQRFAALRGALAPRDEVEGWAVLGLLRAARFYDPVRFPSVPFGPFAKKVICRYLDQQYSSLKCARRGGGKSTQSLWRNKTGCCDENNLREESTWHKDPPDHRHPAPEDEASFRELWGRAARCLDRRYRRVVWLHAVEGLTFDVVGDDIGVSRQRAEQIYKKALEKLRLHLDHKRAS